MAAVLGIFSVWLLSSDSRVGTSLARTSYDWSQSLLPPADLSNSPIVIVYLDLDSYRSEKQNPIEPWNRALHARLLDRLTTSGAKAVAFDILFDEASEDSAADREFARALRANVRVVLAGEISRTSVASDDAGLRAIQYSPPAKLFLDSAAGWGVASMLEDSDFVVRRYFPGFARPAPPSLTSAVAARVGVAETNRGDDTWLRYYGGPFRIPHVSYSAALRTNEIPDDFFRNRIVFVGARPEAGTFLERKDQFRSPFAYWGGNELFMPAVEVQATQLLNLMRGDSLNRLSSRIEGVILFCTALFFAWLLGRFRPLSAAGVAFIGEGAMFGLAALVLNLRQTWFPWMIVEAVQIPAALAGSVLWQSLNWYRQRRHFEAKIREQAALIDKAQDAILVQQLNGRIVYANPSAERLYGWNPAELSTSTISCALAPENARSAALAAGEWMGELEQMSRDGRKLSVSSRCTLIKDALGRAKSFLFINTDVTEKKRLELEFYRAQRAESVGSLAGGMAHDLNNAFAPILMGLQLLQRQRQDEETQRMLSVMEQNTHRGADMVRQVLLFCRGSDSERQPLSFGKLVREMEQMVRQTFLKSINVAALAPADLWPVMGNATQLHQVLLNLCVNARDAMPNGGELTLAADNVELSEVEAQQIPNGAPGRYVMLLVSDTGCGIAPEVLPRIFEPFYTTKPVEKGTGLGLSTVARIISQHQGFVSVKSELNRGTTFEIYLPRAMVAPVESRPPPTAFRRGNGEWILVADDEQAVLEMVSLTLGEQGYQVITAANGAEAVTKFECHASTVRLALLDTDMPIMNGPQIVPILRARAPSLPIILMSGQIDMGGVEPHVGMLAKPFQLDQLLSAVSNNLNGR